MNNNPIAVIDSGVGGLACLGEIRNAFPKEDIIYLGDTAHMPFGLKTKEELCTYAENMAKFLESKGVKMIVVACNTLSSVAIEALCKACPMIIFQDIVAPAVASVTRTTKPENRLGVIATPATISSNAYQSRFERLNKGFDIFYKGCPELSVYIEKGITDGPEMEKLLHEYLDKMVYEDKIDSLLLACTHFPLAKSCIEKLYPELRVIDPAKMLAKQGYIMLSVHDMCAEETHEPSLKIYTTKKTEGFDNMIKLLGLGVESEEVDLC